MRCLEKIIVSLLVVITATGQYAWSQEKPKKTRIAVLDLKDKGVGKDVASILTGILTNRISELGIFEVLSRQDIKNILTHEQDKMLLGCSDASCLVDIGGALGAEELITGEIGRVGKKTIIGLQRIDIRNARVVKRTQRQFIGTHEMLMEEIGHAAYNLMEDTLKAQSGTVLMSISEEGADISVDGKTVGTSPVDKLVIPAGPRDIRVAKKGFIHWARTVKVEPKGVQLIEVSLIPSANFIETYEQEASDQRMWAWITLGTGLALEAGALGLRIYTWQKYDPIEDDYNSQNFRGMTQTEFYDKYKGDMDTAEVLDATAIGLGVAGIIAGAFSLYFFLAGEDPYRYDKYRGIKKSSETTASRVIPFFNGSDFGIRWEFF